MVRTIVATYLHPPLKGTKVSASGDIIGEELLPTVFRLPIRIDVIRRAVHSAITARIQPKGRDPLAGKRRCGHYWGIGHGLARLPRLYNGRAVFAPNVVGGRRQFAPSPLRKIHEEINRKEMQFALASALAATAHIEFVRSRGHIVPPNIVNLPVIVENDLEKVSRVREIKDWLIKVGLWSDIERAQERTRIRAGKGKRRGRRYITPKSILFIVSSLDAPIINAIKNLPGVDYLTPTTLNILKLAPGGQPGRLTVITESALTQIGELFQVITA